MKLHIDINYAIPMKELTRCSREIELLLLLDFNGFWNALDADDFMAGPLGVAMEEGLIKQRPDCHSSSLTTLIT